MKQEDPAARLESPGFSRGEEVNRKRSGERERGPSTQAAWDAVPPSSVYASRPQGNIPSAERHALGGGRQQAGDAGDPDGSISFRMKFLLP